ncbi:MAG: hypothetical protein LBF76_02990 [Holosporales bacterium]|jgi:flagellar motility protein MotE (MotC chaperone)|nr:hypothetical protein [Holosporales bacterium]
MRKVLFSSACCVFSLGINGIPQSVFGEEKVPAPNPSSPPPLGKEDAEKKSPEGEEEDLLTSLDVQTLLAEVKEKRMLEKIAKGLEEQSDQQEAIRQRLAKLENVLSVLEKRLEGLNPEQEKKIIDTLANIAPNKAADIFSLLPQNIQKRLSGNQKVTKIFEIIPPRKAAAILELLSEHIRTLILGGLKERNAAAIMAVMAPKKASETTKALVEPRSRSMSEKSEESPPETPPVKQKS